MSDQADLDGLQKQYLGAVEEWIAAIRAAEKLASATHSVIEIDKWEQAHDKENELGSNVKTARAAYEDALREKFFGF